ncbi:alpha/beta fold hydrolase [Streptomyces sp. M10(2022)]
MRAGSYLADLGALSAVRRLVVLDLRGTGGSAVPDDPSTYRCDRLVDDVEALRAHLGQERMDLLAHSASGDLAALYAARYPQRLRTSLSSRPAPAPSASPSPSRTGVTPARSVRTNPGIPRRVPRWRSCGQAARRHKRCLPSSRSPTGDGTRRPAPMPPRPLPRPIPVRGRSATRTPPSTRPPRSLPCDSCRRRCSSSPGSTTAVRAPTVRPSSRRSSRTASSSSSEARDTTPGSTTRAPSSVL